MIADPANWGKASPPLSVPPGTVCAGMAIAIAGGNRSWDDVVRQAYHALSAAIRETQSGEMPAGSIVLYNDDPQRTHGEILAVFARAIEIAGKAE